MIWLMVVAEIRPPNDGVFNRAMFRAATTILGARSGRSLTAVVIHEMNFGPLNRTAVEINVARNALGVACAALLAAETINGGTTTSVGAGAVSARQITAGKKMIATKKAPGGEFLVGEGIGWGRFCPGFPSGCLLKSNSQAVYIEKAI